MKTLKINHQDREAFIVPQNPELANNGGDYFFYKTPVFVDGEKIGYLFDTSAEFSFCELSCAFTDTILCEVYDDQTYETLAEIQIARHFDKFAAFAAVMPLSVFIEHVKYYTQMELGETF